MFTHYLDNLCIGEGVDQRTVSLRLTVLVFCHLLSVRQVSLRNHSAQARGVTINSRDSRINHQFQVKGWTGFADSLMSFFA